MSQNPQNPAGGGAAPDATLSKSYDPHAIETRIYETWEREGHFAPNGKKKPYCIMIPPPNVTGSLHMGHAFQDTLMDALIRYHRMQGHNTLWQAGTDHAGIATQMVVERQLETEGKTRHDLGREEFVNRIWQWKAESGGTITRQLRRLGASLDWSRERFTMDDDLSRAVTEVFVRLHEEGLIYRGKRLVNWDPVLHTAVSDLEVVSEEEAGHLWHIRYPIAGSQEHLVVATTRPETMLGDTAVAVHPQDDRYKKFIGKMVDLPLTGRKIPVIADEYVDREFGSGCVKITPAHDFNDYEVGRRHNLPLINIFTSDAHIKESSLDDFTWGHRASDKRGALLADGDGLAGKATVDLIPKKYHGLDRFKARKQIVSDLEEQSFIERVQDHKLMVPRGDRTGAVIEPFLTDQWYVKVKPLAKAAIKAVEDGRIRFVPESWNKTYYEWMRNIQDWCISRQIWWGHRIPAWYDADGNIYVARSALDAHAQARKKHGQDVLLEQDEDVLDTWFSSALWPFSTLGWPKQTKDVKTFYPTSVLVTGFDIIFFWVARMIMMGLKFMGDVPFHQVYITGLIRDAHGQKMSKSKGNILDPLDLIDGIDLESLVRKRTSGLMQPQMAKRIEQATRKEFPQGIPAFGTDALRFTMASLATQGRDIKFDLGRIEGYRNFCNKLWNAARYVLMNTEGQDCGQSYEDGAQAPPARPPLPAGEGMGVRADLPHPLPSPKGRGEAGKNLYSVELNAADRWIVSRLQEVTGEVEAAFHDYRFDLAAQAIYSFVWHEYCDWYLELSKVVLTASDSRPEALRGTRRTLVQVLEAALRLLHPVMPFITEEIWQRVARLAGKTGASIMREPFPKPQKKLIDQKATEEMRWTMEVITGLRNIRGEMDIPPSKLLPVFIQDYTREEQDRLDEGTLTATCILKLGKVGSIKLLDSNISAPESAIALVGNMKTLIPLGSLIDKQAELERLAKEMEKIEKDLSKAKAKLANPDFVARAPKNVVEQEQGRVRQFETALANLRNQRSKVEALPG